MAWAFDLAIGCVISVVGFFVHQIVREMAKRSEQTEKLSHRIVVLEERERGLAHQVAEMKEAIDALAADVRFVRENILVLVSQAGGAATGNHVGVSQGV
mgnify:CR=1 FL=1